MSRTIKFLLVLLITLFAAAVQRAQIRGIGDCPSIAVSCPEDSQTPSTVIFSANVVVGPSDKPIYKWTLSKGRIVSGQGTTSIQVDCSNCDGEIITATVENTSFPKECNNQASCSTRVLIPRDPHYPAHWWTPVVDPKKPDWEILPQEAGLGEVILSKRNELGLLSNFAPTPFVFHGKRYASLEGFWQMMKYPEGASDPRAKFPGLEWKYTRDQVAQMVSFEANHAGALASANMEKMGITWVSFEGRHFEYKPQIPGEHYKLIVEATWEKVKQNPEVKKVLLSTGDLILKPDHHQEPNAPAAWRYFEILMQIRRELQKQNK